MKKSLNQSSSKRYRNLSPEQQKLMRKIEFLNSKGLKYSTPKVYRNDPSLGSGDSVWENEWNKLGGYGPGPIRQLVNFWRLIL